MSEVIEAQATDEGIRIVRRFSAPVERVFAAWTTPEDFAGWFGGPQVDVPLDRLLWNAEPGSDWSAVMVLPDGTEIPWAGSFSQVAPPNRLVFDLTDDGSGPRDVVDVEIEPSPEGSTVRFSQLGGSMPAEQYEQAMKGWLGFLEAMAEIVEP